MTIGLVGKKSGMTRIFTDEGAALGVTVIEVGPNRITQIKTVATDGYSAIQLAAGERKTSHLTKPMIGHYAKAGIAAGRLLNECRVDESELEGVNVGDELDLTRFEVGQRVDVVGQSKGKGFQGGVKRWNFTMQDATHGNSVSHRAPGSIGQCQTPGRVFKGKKMAGHMGSEQVTVQSLVVVRVDAERNLLLVKGNVPGAPGSNVLVRPAVKAHS